MAVLAFAVVQFATAHSACAEEVKLRGISLAGAEFREDALPGVYGQDYIYPQKDNVAYYQSRGFNLFRVPFLWERVQPGLLQEFDAGEVERLKHAVALIAAHNGRVILSPHNFGRYNIGGKAMPIGSAQVSIRSFSDFWSRFTREFMGVSGIYAFDLMNEPHDMNGSWRAAAQAGLDAIRAVDRERLVIAPGDHWSGAWSWDDYNEDFLLNDRANNLLYDAHQYFDQDHSGTYMHDYEASDGNPDMGAHMVQPFLAWLSRHHVRGIVTEFGVPNSDPRWLVVADRFLDKLDQRRIPWVYWAGGPWWQDYPLSAEPRDGHDAPIMSVLSKHGVQMP